jgi:type II secretory pathway pseudopilin PulG
MSGSREKDQSDFDLETFVDLFDTAMTSDNAAVQKAFKNLLMVAAIAHAKQDGLQNPQGPLRRLVDDLRNLNRRLNKLEDQQIYPQAPITTTTPYIPSSPGIIGPGGPVWTTTSPNTNWPPTTSITMNTGAKGLVNSEEC